jgi:NitT/TauT family transport system ATP-binding protein
VDETIVLRDVTVGYDGDPVIADLSLTVRRGEFLAIAGRSGIGKTTLLRTIAGLVRPSAGAVTVLGGPPEDARRAKRIGYVAQDPRLHPWLTVLENIELPLRVNARADRDDGVAPREWLQRIGLGASAHRYPHELSGGMRQRVALARALVIAPDVLLMDEPLAAVDEITREELRAHLLDLWSTTRCAVVYVTHDLDEAVVLADRVGVLGRRPSRIVGAVLVGASRPRPPRLAREPHLLDAAERVRALLPS